MWNNKHYFSKNGKGRSAKCKIGSTNEAQFIHAVSREEELRVASYVSIATPSYAPIRDAATEFSRYSYSYELSFVKIRCSIL